MKRCMLFQDLQTFKELLAQTKSLLAEHSGRDRSMSYQVEDFRPVAVIDSNGCCNNLQSICTNHMPQFQRREIGN